MAAHARTATIGVERGFDARVRLVRVRLVDPDAKNTVRQRGVELPLAADYTAPVACMLGLKRRPAASRYDTLEPAARGTHDGFSILTPFDVGRAQLLLVEGAGLSPLMMAHVANQIVGDGALRARYQVWLYRYPMTAPLFYTTARLRTDLDCLYARLTAAAGNVAPPGAVVVAQGPSALLARSLLTTSGTRLWEAVFDTTAGAAHLARGDQALLDSLLRWHRSHLIDRVIAVGAPDNLEVMAAGIGQRAVQLLLQQPPRFRSAIGRIHRRARSHLRPAERSVTAAAHADPLDQALHDAGTAAERALLSLLASPGLLKPAMYASIDLAGGHTEATLAVPISAVLDTGTRQLVIVDRGSGVFEPRTVRRGVRGNGYTEILEGLSDQEPIVVNGNFLIDAESNLKAAVDSLTESAAHLPAPATATRAAELVR